MKELENNMGNCVIFVAVSPKTGIIQKHKQTNKTNQKTNNPPTHTKQKNATQTKKIPSLFNSLRQTQIFAQKLLYRFSLYIFLICIWQRKFLIQKNNIIF